MLSAELDHEAGSSASSRSSSRKPTRRSLPVYGYKTHGRCLSSSGETHKHTEHLLLLLQCHRQVRLSSCRRCHTLFPPTPFYLSRHVNSSHNMSSGNTEKRIYIHEDVHDSNLLHDCVRRKAYSVKQKIELLKNMINNDSWKSGNFFIII